MFYDTSADGAVWVKGQTYKARFDGNGATYIPSLGSDAPRNFPITFALSSVSAGDRSLPLTGTAAVRADNRVIIDRGSFVEQYSMNPDSMEQEFVFTSLPRRVWHMIRTPQVDWQVRPASYDSTTAVRSRQPTAPAPDSAR